MPTDRRTSVGARDAYISKKFLVLPPDEPWRHWSRLQMVPCMRGVCGTGSWSWTWGGLLEGGLPHRVRKEEAHPRPPLPSWPHPSILFPQKLPCHCWPFRQWLSLSRWHDVIAERVHSVAAQPPPLKVHCCLGHQCLACYQIPSTDQSTV